MLKTEKTRRIIEALNETRRFIEREEARADDLRPADMQAHLEFCRNHEKKLLAMLEAA